MTIRAQLNVHWNVGNAMLNLIVAANSSSVHVLGSPTALASVGVDGLVPVSIGEPGLRPKR